jgi:hypothetical protein
LIELWLHEADRHRSRSSRLQLILIGTGSPTLGPALQPNRAIVIDRLRAEVAAHQDKRFGYSMLRSDFDEIFRRPAGLVAGSHAHPFSDLPHDAVVHEAMAEGAVIRLIEAPPVRLAILVCEDLGRLDHHLAPLAAAGVTHIVAPVLSGRLRGHQPYSWEATAARDYARRVGCHVVVADSMAFAPLHTEETPTVAIAYSPAVTRTGVGGVMGYHRPPRPTSLRSPQPTKAVVLSLD